MPAGESSHLLVPINPLLLTTVGIYAYPTPENKKKAVEVLAKVFGWGEEEKRERAGLDLKIITSVN